MPKSTLVLIIILGIITTLLVYVAFKQNETSPSSPQQQTKATPFPTVMPQAQLFISPDPLIVSTSSATAEIQIDTSLNTISSVQLELSYDPTVLTNIAIRPGNFFEKPKELIKEINSETGRISYALSSSQNTSKKGEGTVAVLTFSVLRRNIQATSLLFLPKTTVKADAVPGSALKKSFGATILFRVPNTPNLLPTQATQSGR